MFQKDYLHKPSIVSLKAALKAAVAAGEDHIQLVWGENRILIEKNAYGWGGYGWIGKHSGHDLAQAVGRGL